MNDIEKAFPDQDACMQYLEHLWWKEGIVSPFDPLSTVRVEFAYHYYCKKTRRRFSVLTNTIFSGTKAPLQDWFKVIWLYEVAPELSTIKAAKVTGVRQKTVWTMKQKIENAKNSITIIAVNGNPGS